MNRSQFPSVALFALSLIACSAARPQHAAGTSTRVKLGSAAVDGQSWRAQVPKAAKASPISYPTTQISTLKNGLSVYSVQRPAGVVSVAVVVRGGASTTNATNAGIAALTSRMLTEGTRNKTALKLAEAVEGLGSDLDYDADRDSISLGLEVLPSDLGQALSLLAEVIQSPRFAAADFARVKAQSIDELRAERQDPMRLASLAALRTLLGPDAGAPVNGSPASVEKLDLAKVKAFYQEQITPANTAVIVAGDISPEALQQSVDKAFGGWTKTPAPEPAEVTYAPIGQTRVLILDRPGSVQTAVFAAHPFPKRTEAGYEARATLNSLFGGLFTSRLNLNLREKHAYTYGARSSAIAARRFGLFAITTSVERDATADALTQMLVELSALKNESSERPITPDELARAKADLINGVGSSLEHVSRVAGNVVNQFIFGLSPDYFASYQSRVDAISRADVLAQIEWLQPERLLISLVGDRAVIEPLLRTKGFKVELADEKLLE